MSVENARFAAAQRTAAASRVRRGVRIATWVLIVPMLSFFSFSVVAGARGVGAKPQYAEAIRVLGAHGSGTYLVLREDKSPLERIMDGGAAEKVCWIDSSQLARVSQRWQTGTMTIRYDRGTLDLVTVTGPKEKELRDELGGAKCVLVQRQRTYYLPFQAHTS